jgi:hypothetical protein
MHTRFEHSLGVMETATRAFDVLALRSRALLEGQLQTVPQFEQDTLARARQLVRLMALLHDVGHTAFSHAGDGVLPAKIKRHENISGWVVSAEGPLGKLIDEAFFPGLSEYLPKLLMEAEDVPPQLQILKQIVSGQLDADRTDYLLRDSIHCGVQYGRFDHLRLISSLVAHENSNTGSLAIGVDRGGSHTFEGLILARYYMNTQVYFHRVRRAYDLVLNKWLEAWVGHKYDKEERVLKWDDILLEAQMHKDAAATVGSERQRWAERLVRRLHPRLVREWGDHADIQDFQTAKRVLQTLQDEFKEVEFLFDDKASGSIHKVYVPGDTERVDDLFIVPRIGQPVQFATQSKVIADIRKQFWVLRIFAYFSDTDQRQRVTERALQLA